MIAASEAPSSLLGAGFCQSEAERQRRVFEGAPGFIAILRGRDHVFEFVNSAYVELTGDRKLIGKAAREALPDIDGQGFFERLDEVFASGERFTAADLRISFEKPGCSDRDERYVTFVYAPIIEPDSTVSGIFIEGHDVTEAHKAKDRIAEIHAVAQRSAWDLAHHDQLTGLSNYRQFSALMEERLARSDQRFALLLLDVDDLKNVNDSFGHCVGDRLLQAMAERLSPKTCPLPLHACRIGGDEFAVLVDDCPDYETLDQVARAILASIRPPVDCEVTTLDPQLTIGGVVAGHDGWSTEVLRQNADFALYHAKDVCRGGYVRFDGGMRTAIINRISIIRNTADALACRRLTPYYQPVVRLDTGRYIGLEALVRTVSPDGRIVPASAFSECFSDSRVAVQITDTMLQQVTNDMRYWLHEEIAFEHVGFNISPADFKKGDIEARICNAFAEACVPLKHLILEITETVLLEDPRGEMHRTIASLREKGVLIALDDFGTGFASLTHLIDMPVSIIKIDKSFVERMLTHPRSMVVVGAMIDIGLKLGLKIVAEGVTSDEQRLRLVELGCILGQGHLFAQAADVASVSEMLRSNHAMVGASR